MFKKASEVEQLLAQPYDGPTKEIDGFTYIPANESRKQLDRIFGPLGWSEEPVLGSDNPREGIYTAAVRLTGYVRDDETGEVRAITRAGYGRSTAQATKKEREENGLTVTRNLRIHDTAAASKGTDAFSRACKKFGPAFGSDLYDGGESTSSSTSTTTRRSSGGDLGARPSDKQLPYLLKAGLSAEEVAQMPFSQWKKALDDYFANNKKGATASTSTRRQARDEDVDDLPF